MLNRNQKVATFQAVIITVCLEPELAQTLVDAVLTMPWIASFSHLDAYISTDRRPAFAPQVRAASGGIAFVDFDKDVDEATETTRYLQQTFGSKLIVIAVAKSQAPELILTAMRAGCSEFLQNPIRELALSDTLNRLDRQWSAGPNRSPQSGTILAFMGSKGGVGTTTLAVHLAIYLTTGQKKRVLLVDNHTELGHVCIYLGIDGSHYLLNEVVRNVSRLDSELLHGFVAKHASGLEILSSPDVAGGAKHTEADSLGKTLEFLRTEYDYVLIDCDRSINDVNQTVLAAASRVYVVATPEVGAIRDLSRHVDRLMQLEDSSEKLQIVLNRHASPFAINIEQIEKALRLPVNIKISNNYPELIKSENLGEPIPVGSKLEVSADFSRWAESLAGVARSSETVKKSRSLRDLWSSKPLATQG